MDSNTRKQYVALVDFLGKVMGPSCEVVFHIIEPDSSYIAAITNKMMLLLSIATSIDAMAAGFSLTLLHVNVYLACFIIGVTTFLFSWAGVLIGKTSGTWLESRAEIFGGTVLILMGIKVLLF